MTWRRITRVARVAAAQSPRTQMTNQRKIGTICLTKNLRQTVQKQAVWIPQAVNQAVKQQTVREQLSIGSSLVFASGCFLGWCFNKTMSKWGKVASYVPCPYKGISHLTVIQLQCLCINQRQPDRLSHSTLSIAMKHTIWFLCRSSTLCIQFQCWW